MSRDMRLTPGTQKIISRYGISAHQVLETLNTPDSTDEIIFQELTIRIHAKLLGSIEPPCTLLVLESVDGDKNTVSSAFPIYSALNPNISALRPLEVLQLLTDSFGLLIRVGSKIGRLIAQEQFDAPADKNLSLVEGVEVPRGSFTNHCHFRIVDEPRREFQVALAFAIDDELYGIWLDGVVKRTRSSSPSSRQNKKSKPSPKDTKWKIFEKLVAAIHRAEQKGAEVKWNDSINGRQFDATVRFKAGAYDYLTVIECREKSRPVETTAVEAFVTKSMNVKANKAIMVSSSGFQKGCFDVANQHGIELFTVHELRDLSDDLIENSVLTPALNMHNFSLSTGNEIIEIPEQRNILPFLIKEMFIEIDGQRTSVEQIVDDLYFQLAASAAREPKIFCIEMAPSSFIVLPDIKSGNTLETIRLPITKISFKYRLITSRLYTGDGRDPYIAHTRYEFRNAVSGKSKVYTPKELEVGFDTVLKPGIFYTDVHTEFCYFCHRVEDDLITLTMLEGYQHGRHLQITFSVLRENARSFVEVTDKAEVKRLKAMLRTLRERGGLNSGGEEILDL